MFARELAAKDLSATNVVHSDFVMINQRLAEHYKIPGVEGAAIRRVPLPPDSGRGGFLTQAGILKMTANGTVTSPVKRGAWVQTKIIGPRDRARLDQYFSSVCDLELRLHETAEWEKKPKPSIGVPEPKDVEVTQLATASKLMYDMIRLALENDSTRIVTLYISTLGLKTDIPGVEHETHTLTHHGNRSETLAELRALETAQFKALAAFLGPGNQQVRIKHRHYARVRNEMKTNSLCKVADVAHKFFAGAL